MATIHNSELSNELRDGAKIQLSVDNLPNKLGDMVIPVMEVNPKLLRRVNVLVATSSKDATIYTTPAGKQFFLTGASVSYTKDAGSDNTLCDVRATTPGGASIAIISIGAITLTAKTSEVTREFNPPIPITSISQNNTGTNAVLTVRTTLQGYLVDNPNA
jgi:hypothetical protein